MAIKPGYKQTEVGVIPEDWEVARLGDYSLKVGSGITPTGGEQVYKREGRPFIRSQNVGWGSLILGDVAFLDEDTHAGFQSSELVVDDVLLNITGASIGRSAIADGRVAGGNVNQHVCIIRTNLAYLFPQFLNCFILSALGQRQIDSFQAGGNRQGLNFGQIRSFLVSLPPTIEEQEAIAEALSDADALVESLEELIAKKRHLKQGAMQELLTGKKRLPGFEVKAGYKSTDVGLIPEDWSISTLEEIADCLDHCRIPLNEGQRQKRRGSIPYCGANGVLDYIDDFLIDDDIILLAEDGGYFDEYSTRPIAYRIRGKCWVNNHAHVLKAKSGFSQGFTFYSLVHKNIVKYLASGTRAKLNRSELNRIEILAPLGMLEQEAIANVLTDMDAEIEALEQKLEKARQIKQGMMQELLTGKTRLV